MCDDVIPESVQNEVTWLTRERNDARTRLGRVLDALDEFAGRGLDDGDPHLTIENCRPLDECVEGMHSALWALRRLTMGLERYPLGYELDLPETASAMGLAYTSGTSNTFVRALQRCVLFGVAQPVPDGLAVRRRIPPVAARHLARMPEALQSQHRSWQVRECTLADLERGRMIAEVMLAAGDEPDDVERQLMSVGVGPVAAVEAVAMLVRQAA